jgi:hypothetical protein
MTTTSVSDTASSNFSTDNTQATAPSSSTPPTTDTQNTQTKTTSSAQPQQDRVTISIAAQAQAMRGQGQSVKEIAQNLGITTAVVDTYLGIPSSSGSSGAAAQYSSSQVSQMLNGL